MMTVKDYEERLNKAEENLNKAIILKDKYIAKVEKLADQLKDAGYDPEGTIDWRLVSNDIYNLSFKYRLAKEAVTDSDRKIKDLIVTRDNWKTRLELAKAKENELSEVPTVIKEFVHNWRIKVFDIILNQVSEYEKEYKEVRKFYDNAKYGDPSYKEYMDKYKQGMNLLRRKYSQLAQSLAWKKDKEEELNKILDDEEKSKVLDLIRRVTKVVGTITDASMLTIGRQNGELNGYVTGTEGRCYVETIGAGGYNIQVFHYRVLVKKIRE